MFWKGLQKFKLLDVLTFKVSGTAVTSTATEINKLTGVTATKDELNLVDGMAAAATITIGTEGGGVRAVTIQLKDANGTNLAAQAVVRAYLAGATTGLTVGAITAAGLAIASGGTGLFIANGTSKIDGTLVSSAAGLINAQITGDTGETYYAVVVLPNGKTVISAAITFA